jgi:hypothetical protein
MLRLLRKTLDDDDEEFGDLKDLPNRRTSPPSLCESPRGAELNGCSYSWEEAENKDDDDDGDDKNERDREDVDAQE